MRWIGLLVSAALLACAAPAAADEKGYVAMADGTQLSYTAVLPEGGGRSPVALVYDGYCEGAGPMTCNDAAPAKALLEAGYAVLGVSIRGTSCSGGTFDPFVDQHWKDGAAIVEWAAEQPWSNGRVGMFGDSFPGITQVAVAGLRPPHLKAIAPFQVGTDLYRDVAGPGGLPNSGFGSFWGLGNQPAASYSSAAQQGCADALPAHFAAVPTQNIFLQGLQHLYDDDYWQARRPGARAARIAVPTFSCVSWQDDEISSRGSFAVGQLHPKRTWTLGSNGYHAMCDRGTPLIVDQLVAFFDRFVKGKRNGFKKTPHTQIWHDAHVNDEGENEPGWVARFDKPIRVRPLALFFRPGGALSLTAPKDDSPPADYTYPSPGASNENGVVAGQSNQGWKAPLSPGGAVSYATPPLARDTEFYGSGSANLWMSSTAQGADGSPGIAGAGSDTDIQITLTEVRPDGQEVYVARGWLRASHRKLDRKRSTKLAPYHTHLESDAAPLEAGKPTRMRVQLWPFDYVFRKGSSLRLWIDAPTGATGGWSFDFIKTPATNSVYADAKHPSALVLGRLRGGRAKAPLPKCDTLLNQPCRANPAPVPAGKLTIR